MRIEDYSFRELNHKFVLIKDVADRFRLYNLEFQCLEGDNSLLTYGYIDHEAGLSFELLCFAKKDENDFVQLRPGNEKVTFKIRYDQMIGDIEIVPYDIRFADFQNKIDMINDGYKGTDELEMIRKHTLIDRDRHKQFPDDVCAFLFKSDIKPERVWVRTVTIVDGTIVGRLINQPFSDAFGLNVGDMVKLVSVPVNGNLITVIETADIYD